MKKSKPTITLAMLLSIFIWVGCQNNHTSSKAPWSERMIQSEMKRSPQGWMLNFSKDLSWNYCHGLVCSAMLEAGSHYGKDNYYDYVKQYADTMILDHNHIIGYRVEDYFLSAINTGRILFPIYNKEQKKIYESALHLIRSQLQTQPRTSEGGFWHKGITTNQLWLDGAYMTLPFYSEYAQTFNEPDIYDDVILQIELFRKHLYDPATGLYRHGWDESREQQWADSTGQSPHVWGRAQGWFALGVTDALDYIPETHPKRENIITIYRELMEAVIKYQNPESGLWYQVMEVPSEEGNYPESSVSCMMTYAMLKGVRKGYIDSEPYAKLAEKAYAGILKHFITENKDHTINISQCCEVGGLGGKPYRDGGYDYYIHIPLRDNDPKAVGSFIMASLEMEKQRAAAPRF